MCVSATQRRHHQGANTSSSSIKAAFDENSGWLLAAEVIAILTSAFFAMAGDQDHTPEQASDSTDENEPVHPEAD